MSLRLGPLALAPSLTLRNFGWDSNVFRQPTDGVEEGDFTATTSPRIQGWLRLGRARVRGQSTLDFVYFQNHPSERSVDQYHEGALELPLGRVTPYVSGTWVNAKQTYGFEVDARIRRREQTGRAGADFRLSPRTSIDVTARRSRVEFDPADFQDPFTSEFDDYTSRSASIAVRHELTPFTSVAVTVDKRQDRFDLAPERDSDSLGIASGFEFKPFALVSGKAYLGWLRVDLVEPGSQSFGGVVGAVDLAYTLLGATRLAVQVNRDVSYSAMRDQAAYLLSGVTASATHRLGEGWDVVGRVARHRLSYGLFESSGESGVPPQIPASDAAQEQEIVTDLGGEMGYRIGPAMRLAFVLSRQHRRSSVVAARDTGGP